MDERQELTSPTGKKALLGSVEDAAAFDERIGEMPAVDGWMCCYSFRRPISSGSRLCHQTDASRRAFLLRFQINGLHKYCSQGYHELPQHHFNLLASIPHGHKTRGLHTREVPPLLWQLSYSPKHPADMLPLCPTPNYLRSYLRSTERLVRLPIFPTSKYLRSRHLATAYFDMLRNHDVDTRSTYRRMSLEQRIALFGAVLPNMQVSFVQKTNEALRRILAPPIAERAARIRMASGDNPDAAKPHPATERSAQSARESDGRRIVIPEPHETSLSVACALGRILDSAQVPYAIGGALSFGFWAVPRTTFAVDFNYFTVPDDAGQMLKAIEEHAPITDEYGVV
ncbi:uncharacterized protein EV422DRAFT_164845 [Fimicolochytrium jonesii]|uniref:uncharacterized protein n=1 Tax=Fimicolochytrium jonesii TaxID=1396493 RepID=UPI0022FE122C|nr:uncharacterized protein EV422DRAFT_164845 [Fimicolochytrium jonesii]KAI8818778.1 hypothetical protein EV422DRAFT_164845 [Fimicolochytrium jonesii]